MQMHCFLSSQNKWCGLRLTGPRIRGNNGCNPGANMLKTHTGKLEVKKLSEQGEFEGYGSVFDVEDSGADIVLPGAFSKTLRDKTPSSVKMLWQHDPSAPIGVWDEMKED